MATPPGMKKRTSGADVLTMSVSSLFEEETAMQLSAPQSMKMAETGYFQKKTFMSGNTTQHENNFSEEKTMKKPIPPDLLAQLLSHQQYKETQGKEGKKLKARDLDLSELDLSGRNLLRRRMEPRQTLTMLTFRKAYIYNGYCGCKLIPSSSS